MQEGSCFSISSLASIVSRVVNFSHSDWCQVVSQCGFDLYFPMMSDIEHLFMCLLAKQRLRQRDYCQCFSSRNFMVLGLTLVHLEFIFCVWCKKMVQFCSFVCSCPVFPTPFVEEAVFFPLRVLDSFVVD